MEDERMYSSEGVSWKRWPNRCVRAAAIAGVTIMLLLSVLTMPPIGAAHSGTGESGDSAAIDWGLAPSWPFRGVIAHHGEEYGYMPWLEYRDTNQAGLQFLDTERNGVYYVRLLQDLDSIGGSFVCAATKAHYSSEGVTWVLYGVNRGARNWYVPWGDFAYPLFSGDVANENVWAADSEHDPDSFTHTVSIGADGRTLTGWWIVHDEPACGGHIVFAAHAATGEVMACGWSWSSALFVNPAVTDVTANSQRASVSPDVPSYEDCDLLDLRQWQQALAGQNDA